MTQLSSQLDMFNHISQTEQVNRIGEVTTKPQSVAGVCHCHSFILSVSQEDLIPDSACVLSCPVRKLFNSLSCGTDRLYVCVCLCVVN